MALILLLAWSALAFGGSPTWAAATALVLAITTGILGFLERSSAARSGQPGMGLLQLPVAAALGLVLLAIGLQLLPISGELMARISPARTTTNYEQLLALADRKDLTVLPDPGEESKPISIVSSRTRLGLAGLAGLAILLLGASRGFSIVGTRGITNAIAALGVTVTFVGLYQLTNGTRLVYGWYVPLFADGRSAPFINPNHQAGWLAMVLSLTLGAFAGEVARGMRGVAPAWRDRILWLSTKDANVAALLLFTSAMLAVGILATGARSGAVMLIASFVLVAWWNSRRQSTRMRRVGTAAVLIAIGLAVLAFNGEAVLRELAATEGPGPRLDVWRDTLRIADDFWLTGTGFNTYGAAMMHYQTVPDPQRYIEAHNDYVQLAAEGGVLVGIPFLILAITLVLETRRRFRAALDDTRTYWLRVGAVTGMIAIAVQSMVEFTLQMPGGAAMFTTLLAIAIHHPPTFVKATAGKPPRTTRGRDVG